jgi:hypothetical protein
MQYKTSKLHEIKKDAMGNKLSQLQEKIVWTKPHTGPLYTVTVPVALKNIQPVISVMPKGYLVNLRNSWKTLAMANEESLTPHWQRSQIN